MVALTTMMIRRNESLLLMEAKLVLVLAVIQDLFLCFFQAQWQAMRET
jgi:hypothetical protein